MVEVTNGYRRPDIGRAEVVVGRARHANRRSRRRRKRAIAIPEEDVHADVRRDSEVWLAILVEIGSHDAKRLGNLQRRIGRISEIDRGFWRGDLEIDHV